MKVMAIKQGYFDLKRRKEGSVFEIPAKLFSKVWMKQLDEEDSLPEEKAPVKKAVASRKPVSSNDDVL